MSEVVVMSSLEKKVDDVESFENFQIWYYLPHKDRQLYRNGLANWIINQNGLAKLLYIKWDSWEHVLLLSFLPSLLIS